MIKNILMALGIIVMLVPKHSLGQNPSYGYIGSTSAGTSAQPSPQVPKMIWISTTSGQNWVKWSETEYWKWAALNSYITTPCAGYPGYYYCTAPVTVVYNTAPAVVYATPQVINYGYQAPYYGNCGYSYPSVGFSNYGYINAPGISVSGGISLNGFPFGNNCQTFAPSCGNVFNPPSCGWSPSVGPSNSYYGHRK